MPKYKNEEAGLSWKWQPIVSTLHYMTYCVSVMHNGYVLLCIAHTAVCFTILHYIYDIVQNNRRNMIPGILDFIATHYTSIRGRCGAHWWLRWTWKLVVTLQHTCWLRLGGTVCQGFLFSTNASREDLSLLAFDWPIVTLLTLLLASIPNPVGSK